MATNLQREAHMFRRKHRVTESGEATPTAAPAVVVTGVGPVSAVGCGREAFYGSLVEGQVGYGPITLCDASRSPSKIAAEVTDFALSDYLEAGRKLARITPRSTQMALAAAVLALHDAQIDIDAVDPNRFGAHIGTGVGNIGDSIRVFERWAGGGNMPAHTAFLAIHHSVACVLSTFFNIRGAILTTSTGCNSGVDAMGQAMRAIQSGALDVVLVVGTDCEVVPEIMAALNASGSLTTRYNDAPELASRPFDLGRDGNVVGEGAGALVLESEAHARARRARIYARFAGYTQCAAGEGRQYSHDAPEINLDPSVRAMRGAIGEAGWDASDVHLVNANGSSSKIYDRVEALALAETLGESFATTRVHSIKSMLGQHGAGTSALQAITACLSIRQGVVPPTVNCSEPDPECGPIHVTTRPEALHPVNVLMHSIGLGGFYYSAAAFERDDSMIEVTGASQVAWSEGHARKYAVSSMYQKPLTPWRLEDSWLADQADQAGDE